MRDYYPYLEEGCFYHVFNRGNNGDNLFYRKENYHYFLRKYHLYLSPFVRTYVYCLLPNHFHLLIRVKRKEEWIGKEVIYPGIRNIEKIKDPHEAVALQFRHFFTCYAKAINKQTGRYGSLFQKRFKRLKVNDRPYIFKLVCYIHRNPETHGIIDDFRNYPYSSFQTMVMEPSSTREYSAVLSWFGSKEDFLAEHKIFPGQKDIDEIAIEE